MKHINALCALAIGALSVSACQESAVPVPSSVSYEGTMSLNLPYGDSNGGFVDSQGDRIKQGNAVGTNPGSDVELASMASGAVKNAASPQAAWESLEVLGKAHNYSDGVASQANAIAFLSSDAFKRAPDAALGLQALNALSEAQNPNAEVVLSALQLLGSKIPDADRARIAQSVSGAAQDYLEHYASSSVEEGLRAYKPELADGLKSAREKMEQATQRLAEI